MSGLAPRIAYAMVALTVASVQRASSQRPPATPLPERARTRWVHESWTVQNGLPVNSVNWILQDRVGYIWIATYDGLVRFDGVRFTVFNSANSEGLPSNRIIDVREGRDGALWLRTEQGHLVRFRDGRFRHFASLRDPREAPISRFAEDRSGTVWLALPNGLWAIRGDSVQHVAINAIPSATAVLARRDGTLWVATTAGIVRVAGGAANARVTPVSLDSALVRAPLTALYDDPSGTVWAAGPDGLWAGRERLTTVSGGEAIQNPQAVFATPATGTLWIADGGTLYRVEAAGTTRVARPIHTLLTRAVWADARTIWYAAGVELFRDGEGTFTLPSRLPVQVAPEVITAVLVDREGSVWLGTRAAGLHRLKPALFRTYGAQEGLASSAIYPTFVDRSGVVWAGTWGQGIGRVAPPNDSVIGFHPTPSINRFAYSFVEDTTRTLWIATGEGLYACDVMRTRCALEGPAELRRAWVRTVYHDNAGRIWASTTNSVFLRDANGWTKLDSALRVPADVRAFAQARDGSVWMGTNGGGLARFSDGHVAVLTTADGLPSDVIRTVHRDADGYLWIGTEGRGIARLDPTGWASDSRVRPTGQQIVRVSSRDGLFDDAIHQILEDDFGRLWMSTNRGIFWVSREELNAFASGTIRRVHSTAYTERDGMRNREANGGSQPAGAKGPDGRLWFPTLEGVVVVDPARVRGDTGVASVVVEQVVTRNASLHPLGDSVTLRPDQRDVQIEYTALTFLQPGNVRFRYRLENYDADWVDVGGRRTAFYTKLPPGRYTFRVAMSGGGGAWQSHEGVVTLHVVPRLWETAGFRWTMVAALGTLLVAAWRVRDVRLRSRAALLERVVEERTAALRSHEQELARQNAQLEAQAVQLRALDVAKTRFFANVSHELRTPLTLTVGPLEDLRAEVGANPRAARWIDLALRNSRRLLRLVNQILDVGKLEAGQMRLSPRPLDLVPFARGIVSAFTPVAERKGLRLTLDAAEASCVVLLDPDAFEKILTNLLSNAVKFTPEGGTVDVTIARGGDALRMDVRDTGPGIPADQLVHVFERFYQVDETRSRLQPGTGIGLSLVKELVQLQDGTIEVRSSEAGTTFIVKLPAPAAAERTDGARVTPNGGMAIVDAPSESDTPDSDTPDDDTPQDTTPADIPTLLVVDDSEDLREYIRGHFDTQFHVIEASEGAEGIELTRRHLPDVIISDVMMPGTDGYALVRALRADRETDFIPVILLTAQAEDEQKIAGLDRGADDYLTKPFDMRELGARVRNLSARHRRLRERVASAARLEEPRAVADELAPADRAFVEKVRAAIRKRLGDPDFGVAELARDVAQDRSHLFRRVKQILSETPTELIRRLRLEEAERLLMSEQGTVADVAYAVGFNSLSYFCECFRERYGATPAAYRDRARATTVT